jgi:hypothetical protein
MGNIHARVNDDILDGPNPRSRQAAIAFNGKVRELRCFDQGEAKGGARTDTRDARAEDPGDNDVPWSVRDCVNTAMGSYDDACGQGRIDLSAPNPAGKEVFPPRRTSQASKDTNDAHRATIHDPESNFSISVVGVSRRNQGAGRGHQLEIGCGRPKAAPLCLSPTPIHGPPPSARLVVRVRWEWLVRAESAPTSHPCTVTRADGRQKRTADRRGPLDSLVTFRRMPQWWT